MYYDIDVIYNIKECNDYMNFKKPYVIKGGCKNMKIFNNEKKMDFLKNSFDNIIFPIEIYENDIEMGETNIKNRKEIEFSKVYNKITNNNTNKKYYLAEIDLFEYEEQLPANFLKNFDIDLDNHRINEGMLIFFGNNGKSGCHLHTSHDYVLNQIVGKKTVYMFDYDDNNVEFCSLFSDKINFIKENFFTMNKTNMKIYKVVLDEGDSLIIPPWWWHAVEGNGLNYSITKTYDRYDYTYLFSKPYLFVIIIVSEFFGIIEQYNIIIVSILLILLIFYMIIFVKNLLGSAGIF